MTAKKKGGRPAPPSSKIAGQRVDLAQHGQPEGDFLSFIDTDEMTWDETRALTKRFGGLDARRMTMDEMAALICDFVVAWRITTPRSVVTDVTPAAMGPIPMKVLNRVVEAMTVALDLGGKQKESPLAPRST